MTAGFDLPRRPRILVITLRRLGDVLLTTPLVRTLRRGFPEATLDMFVFAGSERILKGNPDIDSVVTLSQRPTTAESVALIRRLWRSYDLVVSTQTGDRPTFFAMVAGRRRAGLVPRRGDAGAWWKSRIFDCPVAADPTAHRVVELRKLATAIGVTGWADIVCPQGTSVNDIAPKGAYAVIHANPMYRYKRWVDAGWRELARALTARGLDVVATEGREPAERDYADRLWEAAGAGCPTVALYGPTSPRLIGPWPVGGLDESWAERGTIQRRGNVWLVQNPLPCLPCEKLGCERHLESYSRCLDELTPAQVLRAVDEALESRRASTLQPQAPRVAAR
jgi:heptosyltransferase-3